MLEKQFNRTPWNTLLLFYIYYNGWMFLLYGCLYFLTSHSYRNTRWQILLDVSFASGIENIICFLSLHRGVLSTMALPTAEFWAFDHDSPPTCKRPISALAKRRMPKSGVRTRSFKQKFAASPWNTLAVSTQFPAYVSAVSLLTVSRAMKLGRDVMQNKGSVSPTLGKLDGDD